jgi:hypothetical protein
VVAKIDLLLIFSVRGEFPHLDPGKYRVTLSNNGKEDAINLQVKIVATDLGHTLITNLLREKVYEIPKLRNEAVEHMDTAMENDQDFVVGCVEYSNDQGTRFADPPAFYATPPWWGPPNQHEPHREFTPVKAWEDAKLSEGFSCAAL